MAALASVPKIEPGDFTDLIKALAKFVTDGNINVSTAAVVALGHLAGGLGKGFVSYIKVGLHSISYGQGLTVVIGGAGKSSGTIQGEEGHNGCCSQHYM